MDKFDRNVQRELLALLYENAPHGITQENMQSFIKMFGSDDNFIANLKYLEGHGLISCHLEKTFSGFNMAPEIMEILPKGIDFMRNDGGLGAILNVVNFRLHDDTLKKLEAIISASSIQVEEKVSLISTLRKLPEDAIKHLNLKLLDMGLAHLPNVIHAIQTAMQSL